MHRFSPLIRGGAIGAVLVFLSGAISFGQIDFPACSYRLEKIGIIQCDFGTGRPNSKTGGTDEFEFRVGRNGDLYFGFYEQGKICRLDSGGKLIRAVFTGVPLTRRSSGFALSPEGDLFVLDGPRKNLYRYDASLDLIGKYSVAGGEELEPICGFVATSWGDLLVAGGLKLNIWKLQPLGQGFLAKPIYLPETYHYSFLSEITESRILATDPLGHLIVLDRFGNLLKTVSFRKGLGAAAFGRDFLVTFCPPTGLMVLDTVGVVLASWKIAELDSVFEKVVGFQVVQEKAYFLLPSLEKVLVLRIVCADLGLSIGERLHRPE